METETIINQKEYLKKYLAIGKAPGEKKKKKRKINAVNRVKIIDDDAVEFTSTVIEKDPLIVDEDAPQIVAIIDERPPSMRIDEKTNNPLWQPIGSTESANNREQKQMITGFKIASKSNDKIFAHPPDRSPPRRRKPVNDSPPREAKRRNYSTPQSSSPARSTNNSPPPKIKIEVEDDSSPRISRNDDISPPRKIRSDDISPPRKSRNDGISPPRKSRSDDISPPRKQRRNRTPDHSPPRKHERGRSKIKDEKSSSKMEKTLDGKRAGLQDAKQLASETKQIRIREDQLFKNLAKEVSGENAETVFRKSGRNRIVEEDEERQRKKREEEEKNKEKYSRWGRGLVQVENRDQKIQEELREMSKPLARYADDEDLEKYLKEQEREGDPMLAYIRSKKRKKAAKEGKAEKPQFEGQFMPNRYGIKPGHRWDGVDRSNGYEKKWFEVQNAKRAQQEDIYKWSTEDM